MTSKHYLDQMQALATFAGLPDWFRAIQNQAHSVWQDLQLPVIERVKYHRWPLLSQEVVAPQTLEEPLLYGLDAALAEQDHLSGQLVHVGNHTLVESLDQDLVDQGVIVTDLFQAMADYPDLVKEHLFSVIGAHEDQIEAYHTAFMNGGLFIYVPRNVAVTLPLEALLVQDSRYGQAFNKHVLIVLEQGASLDYVERLETYGDKPNSATYFVEVVVKSGAQIKYSAVDTLGAKSHAYIKRYAQTARDAKIDWAIGELNDGNVILDLDTYLNGDGSESQVQIVGISTGKQIQGIDSKVVNRGNHSVGNILQHGVILDRATLTFNGIGLIEKYAKGADAQQESRVLMLSEKARGDANPILLIEEFEVTAGHAASVGQVDEEQLYYLMSRGLSREAAEYLVVRGFLGPVIVQMPSAEIRRQLVEIIDRKLSGLEGSQED